MAYQPLQHHKSKIPSPREWLTSLIVCLALALNSAPSTAAPSNITAPQSVETSKDNQSSKFDTEDLATFLDGLVREQMNANKIPGAAVAVTQGNNIVYLRGVGFSNVAAQIPVDPERHLFRVASVSKPFVWMSIIQLADRGKLALDEDINTYLDFSIPDTFPGQPISLRHLITHTSGFEAVNIGASVRTAAEREPLSNTVKRMLPERAAPPGARTAYSNYGAALAGYIVERVSGAPYPDYLEQNIFTPLNMTHSSIRQPLQPDLINDLASGYTIRDGARVKGQFEYMNLYPNGAMMTTATDMAQFAIAHLSATPNTAVLGAQAWESMHERQFGNVPQVAGMTFGFEQSMWNGRTTIGHGGDISFYKTQFLMMPNEKVSIFISFNSDQTGDAATQIISGFMDRYFPGEDGDNLFSGEPVPNATDDVEGTFVPSRKNISTIEKLFWPMTTGVSVTKVNDKDIKVQFFGKQRPYRRIKEGVYVPANPGLDGARAFGALVAHRNSATDETELMFSKIGSFMFEKTPNSENLRLHLALLVASLAVGAIGIGLTLAGFLAGAKQSSTLLWGSASLPILGTLTAFAFIPLILSKFNQDLVYGVSDETRLYFLLPPAGVFLVGVAIVKLGFGLRAQTYPAKLIVGAWLSLAALSIFAWQLNVWNMFGFGGLPA